MSTSYPGALDSYTTKVDSVDDVLAADVNNLQDAVVAIETELGVDPVRTGTWTPTVTQTGSVTVTVTHARYRINYSTKICHVAVALSITGSGSGTAPIIIGGQPAAIQPINVVVDVKTIGTGSIVDQGTAQYFGFVVTHSATEWYIFDSNTRGVIGNNPAFNLANTDVIVFTATYEVA